MQANGFNKEKKEANLRRSYRPMQTAALSLSQSKDTKLLGNYLKMN